MHVVLCVGNLKGWHSFASPNPVCCPQVTELEKPKMLMSMFTKRGNARWTETQQFEPAHAYSIAGYAAAAGGGQAPVYRKAAAENLRAGAYAIQVMLGDNYLQMETVSGHATSLWSADPWELLKVVFPAKVASLERVQGVPMGPRLLISLANAAEMLAGAEAVKKMCVVLHCNEEQVDIIAADLRSRNFCG